MNRKPNFFIVGAAKSGTTAMDQYLSEHPDVFMANKEPHYFATDLIAEGHPTMSFETYESLFAGAKNEKVVGESSVFYLFSKIAAQKIKEFNNDAKIQIHIRNPVDVIPSHHSQLIYVGGEPVKDLEAALKLEPLRKSGKETSNFLWKDTLRYLEFVQFSGQIENFIEVFGRERIHFVIFDDLVADISKKYRRVCEFLEIDGTFEPNFEVVNANKVLRSEYLMNFLVRDPPRWLSGIAQTFVSKSGRDKMKGTFSSLLTSYRPRAKIQPELHGQLQCELAPEIERLSKLLGRDLTHWSAV